MKKICTTLVLLLSVLLVRAESSSPYQINDHQVSRLLAQSQDISLQLFNPGNSSALFDPMAGPEVLNAFQASKLNSSGSGGKTFVAALLLDFFLGPLGIHRLYLGTKTLTWVGYILTCGGIFGIVPLIDFIELIVHSNDISPFVNNPKFFMWANSQ